MADQSTKNRSCPNCGSHAHRLRYDDSPPFRIVECLRCELVYLANPPESDQLYESYYEASAPASVSYERDSEDASLAEMYAINEQRVAAITERVAPETLLDVGCGRGYFLETARRHEFDVTGIDISERAVEQARSIFSVDARVRTISEIAKTSASFEVVTLWHVLEHFLDPFEALQHVKQLLTEGGCCFVEVPNLHSLKFMLAQDKWEGGNHPKYHRTFFTNRTLKQALKDSGFDRVRRLKLSYQIPNRSPLYEAGKRILNQFALDAFLTFVAWK